VNSLSLDIDLANAADAAPLYEVERVESAVSNSIAAQSGAIPAKVLINRELQNVAASKRSTRHIEVALPQNSDEIVGRILKRFGFSAESQIRIRSSAGEHSLLPVDEAISVHRLLSQMLELQAVASRRDVATLARHTECPRSAPLLNALAEDDYKSKVQQKRRTILDLLEEFEACELPFGVFLELMPMLTPRYYSISSSPQESANTCSITVGVVDEPAISGLGQFKGVCSNHLARTAEGAQALVSVRAADDGFQLPDDPMTPVIMIGPGTGIAPFRGFLSERAAKKAAGTDIGPAMLFFGCRHPEQDFIYREELEAHAAAGIADLHVAFSRQDKKKTYVQDLLRDNREAVWALLEQGARVYVCGDGSRMEPDVRRALSLIYSEEKDVSGEAADAWLAQMAEDGRYNLDVWVTS
jgi:cytochrome P450/NADPH-cytochrome P450 reductase